jgi:hypothetical protein
MDMYVKQEIEIEEEEENIIIPTEEKENATILINEKEETLMLANVKQIEEVKMLSEVREPLLDLDKCSLHELIVVLEKISKDPIINVNQAGFGSCIANYVNKEKIERYKNEAMITPKLGDDYWIPKILISIDRETHHAILDLGSSELYLRSYMIFLILQTWKILY